MEAEAEAEAVDGKLKEAEAEAKEKLTAVPSLFIYPKDHILKALCPYLYFWLRYMGVNQAYNT